MESNEICSVTYTYTPDHPATGQTSFMGITQMQRGYVEVVPKSFYRQVCQTDRWDLEKAEVPEM